MQQLVKLAATQEAIQKRNRRLGRKGSRRINVCIGKKVEILKEAADSKLLRYLHFGAVDYVPAWAWLRILYWKVYNFCILVAIL